MGDSSGRAPPGRRELKNRSLSLSLSLMPLRAVFFAPSVATAATRSASATLRVIASALDAPPESFDALVREPRLLGGASDGESRPLRHHSRLQMNNYPSLPKELFRGAPLRPSNLQNPKRPASRLLSRALEHPRLTARCFRAAAREDPARSRAHATDRNDARRTTNDERRLAKDDETCALGLDRDARWRFV